MASRGKKAGFFVHPYNKKFGWRTGKDPTAGKHIRKDEDGYENFEDYLTESESENTMEIKMDEKENKVFVDGQPEKRGQTEAKLYNTRSNSTKQSFLADSQSSVNQKVLGVNPVAWLTNQNIGRRTGKDLMAGKNIRKDEDGYENFADYLSESDADSLMESRISLGHHLSRGSIGQKSFIRDSSKLTSEQSVQSSNTEDSQCVDSQGETEDDEEEKDNMIDVDEEGSNSPSHVVEDKEMYDVDESTPVNKRGQSSHSSDDESSHTDENEATPVNTASKKKQQKELSNVRKTSGRRKEQQNQSTQRLSQNDETTVSNEESENDEKEAMSARTTSQKKHQDKKSSIKRTSGKHQEKISSIKRASGRGKEQPNQSTKRLSKNDEMTISDEESNENESMPANTTSQKKDNKEMSSIKRTSGRRKEQPNQSTQRLSKNDEMTISDEESNENESMAANTTSQKKDDKEMSNIKRTSGRRKEQPNQRLSQNGNKSASSKMGTDHEKLEGSNIKKSLTETQTDSNLQSSRQSKSKQVVKSSQIDKTDTSLTQTNNFEHISKLSRRSEGQSCFSKTCIDIGGNVTGSITKNNELSLPSGSTPTFQTRKRLSYSVAALEAMRLSGSREMDTYNSDRSEDSLDVHTRQKSTDIRKSRTTLDSDNNDADLESNGSFLTISTKHGKLSKILQEVDTDDTESIEIVEEEINKSRKNNATVKKNRTMTNRKSTGVNKSKTNPHQEVSDSEKGQNKRSGIKGKSKVKTFNESTRKSLKSTHEEEVKDRIVGNIENEIDTEESVCSKSSKKAGKRKSLKERKEQVPATNDKNISAANGKKIKKNSQISKRKSKANEISKNSFDIVDIDPTGLSAVDSVSNKHKGSNKTKRKSSKTPKDVATQENSENVDEDNNDDSRVSEDEMGDEVNGQMEEHRKMTKGANKGRRKHSVETDDHVTQQGQKDLSNRRGRRAKSMSNIQSEDGNHKSRGRGKRAKSLHGEVESGTVIKKMKTDLKSVTEKKTDKKNSVSDLKAKSKVKKSIKKKLISLNDSGESDLEPDVEDGNEDVPLPSAQDNSVSGTEENHGEQNTDRIDEGVSEVIDDGTEIEVKSKSNKKVKKAPRRGKRGTKSLSDADVTDGTSGSQKRKTLSKGRSSSVSSHRDNRKRRHTVDKSNSHEVEDAVTPEVHPTVSPHRSFISPYFHTPVSRHDLVPEDVLKSGVSFRHSRHITMIDTPEQPSEEDSVSNSPYDDPRENIDTDNADGRIPSKERRLTSVTTQLNTDSAELTPCLRQPGSARKSKGRRVTISKLVTEKSYQVVSDNSGDSSKLNEDGSVSLPVTPSINSTPVHIFETTNTDTPVCYQPPAVPKVLRPDDPPDGLRRSRRNRCKPVAWYKGERIIYARRKSGLGIVRIEPSQVEMKIIQNEAKRRKIMRKAGNRSKLKSLKSPARNLSVHVTYDSDLESLSNEEVVVINEDTGEEVIIECMFSKDQEVYLGPTKEEPMPSDPYIMSVTASQKSFITGSLIIRPLEEKPMQIVTKGTMLFKLEKGKVAITIHRTLRVAEAGDTFFVPKGNVYSLKNLRKDEAKLCFTCVFINDSNTES